MKQTITCIDLGNGDKIKKYNILDLENFINSERPILSVQKSVIKNGLDKILEGMGIENINSEILEKNMGRAGFFSIESKEFGELGFLATKGADSTKSFAKISDYYLGGTDIGDKVQAIGLELEQIEKVLGEILWGYKTELLLLLSRKTLNTLKSIPDNIYDIDLDILTTKFTPTLTKKVIEQLPKNFMKPTIDTVDSNSELNIQIQEILNPGKKVGAIEIVQSGKSLIATDAFPVQNGIIYTPSKRNKETGKFNGEIIGELDPDSQAGKIASGIGSEVNLALYNIISNKNNKPQEFIKAIQNSMKNFKN